HGYISQSGLTGVNVVDAKELRGILDAVAKTDVNELTLETSDYKLSVKRGDAVVMQSVAASVPLPAYASQVPSQTLSPQTVQSVSETPVAKAEVTPVETSAAPASNLVDITAPIVGTFYSAASPEAPTFIKVGDKIEPGKVLCIIEAMKLMNEIEAELSGTVAEILVKNEEPVEYGQVLFRVSPSK
ncbi:MAG: acetyl-CoA carboxylase biotin carboxyl carrier protein, partial [Trueperaceae bacterium]